MTPEKLTTMFPRASKAFIEANSIKPEMKPGTGSGGNHDAPSASPLSGEKVVRQTGFKSKAEAEFGMILEAQKRRGEIDSYEYEGVTLKWGEGKAALRYKPDYIVLKTIPIECEHCGRTHTRLQSYVRIIEVKGGHIWEDSLVKFKAARARWPQFQFEMHQKKGGLWERIF